VRFKLVNFEPGGPLDMFRAAFHWRSPLSILTRPVTASLELRSVARGGYFIQPEDQSRVTGAATGRPCDGSAFEARTAG
jgi:hypothetical protein